MVFLLEHRLQLVNPELQFLFLRRSFYVQSTRALLELFVLFLQFFVIEKGLGWVL